MKIDEIYKYHKVSYLNSCECGKKHEILTMRNNFSEYETEVYVLCECGEYIEFILPCEIRKFNAKGR